MSVFLGLNPEFNEYLKLVNRYECLQDTDYPMSERELKDALVGVLSPSP
jgi:hypothetical protein